MLLPDFVIYLATITPMYEGSVAGGGGLLPPLVVQLLLQTYAGVVVGSVVEATNPLKGGGAWPPLRLFSRYQLLFHQLTVVEDVAAATVRSPSVNTPLLGKANTVAVVLALDAW